ncbi:MAG: ABC transporter ATP-binding protein, partial [Clostridiales bacterium]|nr:ABC transporter ATP-binding protein [Clostridiales bacterium]
MLKLSHIAKDYQAGDSVVHALRDVSVCFRPSEFVAVLGPSGCGKTTLLNIIGGLDQYTEGDLIISGTSTREFRDRDWDSYRNHRIGFVFQSYNLIPHQTVLQNVELALTLSGVSKAERRTRAKQALEKVGLGDQLHKKPNQMSGGQMQRVAIARALVNDPDILLADEPTGALDSETSVQIMQILKSISQEKLIIMVTHNPELAAQYATRTVRLLDGKIISDSQPYEPSGAEAEKPVKTQQKRTSMSFLTALGLSCNNLLTKKARTILTAFAGSIGIIGIALILSLSNGIQTYIDQVQEDTLSSYPITIEAESMDM